MIDIALRGNDDNYTTARREGTGSEVAEISSGGGESPSSKHSNMETHRKNIVQLGQVEYPNTPHSYHLSSTTGHHNIFGGSDTIDGKSITFVIIGTNTFE